ncbi:hypothetical protein ECV0102_09090 [Enterobacter cloacae]|nr:hypothetical protein ECV0102_09090 [Enterobacter cloacae]
MLVLLTVVDLSDTLPPLAVTEAHKVCFRDVMFSLLSARSGRRSAKRKADRKTCPLATYAVARSFQESE